MKQIALGGKDGIGKYAVVDDEDYLIVKNYSYHLSNRGYVVRCVKKSIGGKNKKVKMHREILHAEKGAIVDHINGDKLDNRKSNLRFCNSSQNNANRSMQSFNNIGFKGVSYKKSNKKYCARIGYAGKEIFLGYFDNAIDASNAYDSKAIELYGSFAKTNNADGLLKAVQLIKKEK